MGRSKVYIVSDDFSLVQRTKAYCHSQGLEVEAFTSQEWESRQKSGAPSLTTGSAPVDTGATIIPFPGSHATNVEISQGGGKVKTINELESMAIENAIFEYNGNLTEAAKALGIGRATLYRKVKQYSIDPSAARKKRAA